MLITFKSNVGQDQQSEKTLPFGRNPQPRPKRLRKRLRFFSSEMTKVKVRPRIQRAFFRWLAQNQNRLVLELFIENRTDRYVEFSFVGVNGTISATLNGYEIYVSAKLKGECWDLLGDWDSSPIHCPSGYFCKSCRDHFITNNPSNEFTRFFSSREAVWVDDIFEPFLKWINEDLATSKWLGFYGELGNATWVKLMKNCADELAIGLAALLPCREV